MVVKVLVDYVGNFLVFPGRCVAAVGALEVVVAVLLVFKVVGAKVGHFEVLLDHSLILVWFLREVWPNVFNHRFSVLGSWHTEPSFDIWGLVEIKVVEEGVWGDGVRIDLLAEVVQFEAMSVLSVTPRDHEVIVFIALALLEGVHEERLVLFKIFVESDVDIVALNA